MEGLRGLGKDDAKTAFDDGRAKLWTEFVRLHAWLDPLIQSGQVTGAQLASGVATVMNLIARHKALFAQGQKDDIPTSWLDPRYADYEKPMEQYLADLQVRAAATGVTTPSTAGNGSPVFQQMPDLSTPTQLIISGGNNTPAGIPSAAGVSTPGGGGGVFADLFGPPPPVAAPSPGFMSELGPMVPWVGAGLALAYFLRKK